MSRSGYLLLSAFACLPALAGYSQSAVVPVSYTIPSTTYSQTFDGLPATGSFSFTGKGPINLSDPPVNASGLNGWQLWMHAGSGTNAGFAASTGSATGSGCYSYGTAGSPERALGSLASGSGIYAFGVILTNNTGIPLNTCQISFNYEQWRKGGSGNKNTWTFRYRTGSFTGIDQPINTTNAALDIASVISTISAATLNGNLAENKRTVSLTLQNIHWKNGEQLLLRWDDADETGSDDACAIDNFSFSASRVISPPLITILPATGINSSSATLRGRVNDGFDSTAVDFEYDSSILFNIPVKIAAAPANIATGSGSTDVSVNANGLLTGATYYYRIKAENATGLVTSNSMSFTTSFALPVVHTQQPSDVSLTAAMLGGSIISTGGASITERGVAWSLSNALTPGEHKFAVTDTAHFSRYVTDLPQGTVIYTRAYAVNLVGIAYGNTLSFTTATNISSLTAQSPIATNASTVNFLLKTAQPVTGLSVSNFSLIATGISGAVITGISGTTNSFTITVNTGSGDGTVALQLNNDAGLNTPIYNKPFSSSDIYRIDKSPPVITRVSIPDTPMKYGDTIPVIICVKKDTVTYHPVTVKINGITATDFSRQNDSSYLCMIVIKGTQDIAAADDIPVAVVLKDATGNSSTLYQVPIVQSSDLIDVSRPVLSSVLLPVDGVYKAGDTLNFIFRFNEKIRLGDNPANGTVSVTIGSRSKPANYISGDRSDSLLYRYVIQPGESDNDGIRFSSPLTFAQTPITDGIGNPALLTYNFPSTAKILVDGIIPVVAGVTTPLPAIYRPGNILDFIVHYSKKIWLDTTGTAPSIPIIIGNTTRNAVYISGSGSNSFLFRYMVQVEDMDKDGIGLGTSIDLYKTSLHDEAGNTASVELKNIGALSKIIINPPTTTVTGITVPADSLYKPGDILSFVVHLNEKVYVNSSAGTPALRFTAGNTQKQAPYTAGSGSTDIGFQYIVQQDDLDSNGITISTSISLNNGTIRDERGNDVPVSLSAIKSAGIMIDGVSPVIRSVITPQKNTYQKNDTLLFTVNFSETVIASSPGTLYLQLQIGDIIRRAMYAGGSGTPSFLFSYTIQSGDVDRNGIKLDSTIFSLHTHLKDIAGNTASPLLKGIGALSGIRIDAVAPYFISDSTKLETCSDKPVYIDEFLQVKYDDNDTLNWQLVTASAHGTLTDIPLTGNISAGFVSPGRIIYTPSENHPGHDSITIQVSDGVYSIRKTIYINVQQAIGNNRIGPAQLICSGERPATITGESPSGGSGVYSFTWEQSVTSDTTGFKTVTTSNGLPQYAPAILTATNWFRRKVTSGKCMAVSSASRITVVKTGFWTGGFDRRWNNPNNWCGSIVPQKNTDAIIDGNALYAPLISDSAYCRNISFMHNGNISVEGYFHISGKITPGSGNINASKGTIVFNGSEPQTTGAAIWSGNLIKEMIIDNIAGVTADAWLRITATLVLRSGFLVTNNNIRLANTAAIGPSAENTSVQGNVSIEYTLPGGRKTFRLLGHPFSTAVALEMIGDSLDITGSDGAINGFVTTATNHPSAFFHDAHNSNDSTGIDAGWKAFASTRFQQGNTWDPYKGIRLLVRGKPGQGIDDTPAGDGTNGTYLPLPATLLMSGPVNSGEQEVRLAFHQRPTYHVIANPYPSAIDLSLVTVGNGISSHYWLWDPWLGNSGGYTGKRFSEHVILPAFGSFIVRVNDTLDNHLLFTENCKDTLAQNPTTAHHLKFRLETDSAYWDEVTIVLDDRARIYFDGADAEKFHNETVNFYSTSRDKKKLSIDTRPVDNESIIPLGFQTDRKLACRIKITSIDMPAGNTLQLHDKYLGKWIPLKKDSSYFFTVTDDTLSKGDQRFELSAYRKVPDTALVYKLVTTLQPVPATDQLWLNYNSPAAANTSIRILSQNGMMHKQLSLGLQKAGRVSIPLQDIRPGIYLIEIRSGELISTHRFIKQ